MKILTISLYAFFLFFAGGGHAQTSSESQGLGSIFASMLKESMGKADLVADVEVIRFQPEKRTGGSTLYRIESRMLESFKGPFLKTLVFYQWTDEKIKAGGPEDDVTGSRIIVTLRKNEQNGRYYVPAHGSSFPESEDLLEVARKIAKVNSLK